MARRPLRVGSTFSGVGGADLGLERAGFSVAWMCEADQWKRTVLRTHWPDIPIYDDVRTVASDEPFTGQLFDDGSRGADAEPVDLLCGGFPCQDLSVAGKRRGFDGDRSVLAFEFLRIAETLQPRWLLMENVPGLLSSNGGRDLARLLDELGAAGYGWAFRVLDARYFGVPQRRRRIFIVARRNDFDGDSGAAAELALRAIWEGSGGDPTPSWPPRQETPAGTEGRPGSPRIYNASAQFGQWVGADFAYTLSQRDYKTPNHLMVTQPISFYPTGGSYSSFARTDSVSPTLKAADGPTAIAFTQSYWVEDCENGALRANGAHNGPPRTDKHPLLAQDTTVRRLTPIECERLMGWPDNWTAPIGVADNESNRYAACGDGIVSWVAYWIGCRIRMIEDEAA